MTKSARPRRLELRMSDELHDELRTMAAEADCSVSLLARELLRHGLGMPSTDGGLTLEALGWEWEDPEVTEGDAEPEPQAEATEAQPPAPAAETAAEPNGEPEPVQEAPATPAPAFDTARQEQMTFPSEPVPGGPVTCRNCGSAFIMNDVEDVKRAARQLMQHDPDFIKELVTGIGRRTTRREGAFS